MESSNVKYRRDMGTFGVLFIVINGLIGAGIFGLPEALFNAVGMFSPWLLLIGGILVMTIVICFAELTKATDASGGPLAYLGSIAALPILRKQAGLAVLSPVIVIAAPIAIIISLWAVLQINSTHWQTLVSVALVGTFFYFIAQRNRKS